MQQREIDKGFLQEHQSTPEQVKVVLEQETDR